MATRYRSDGELPQPDTANVIAQGRQVIRIEGTALDRLADALDDAFVRAVRMILAASRRVVVTGIGKSGHVARKIVATLAATGTPALFLHPAEAVHGDLGMLTPGDILLVLSNSGSTPEVRPTMRHARTLGCAIIAITSRPHSPVTQEADVVLLLPEAREACPVNIAPTTSTTMMLALGDALAVTVMGLRGISRERIRVLHPGGTIGASLTRVEDLMHDGDSLPLVPPTMPMREVMAIMTQKSLGLAGVVDDDGHLMGMITDGDLRRHIDKLMVSRAADVMTPRPRTLPVGGFAGDARALMAEARVTALFVVARNDPGRPVGVLHIHDLSRRDAAASAGYPPPVTPDWDRS